VLQCDAVCCSVVVCVCSVMQCVVVWWCVLVSLKYVSPYAQKENSLLHCVAVCCSVLHSVAVCCSVLKLFAVCCSALHYVAVWCSVVQCVGAQKRLNTHKQRT